MLGLGVRTLYRMIDTRDLPAYVRPSHPPPPPGEARRVAASEYVAAARRLGHGGWWVARRHLLAHLVPQFTVGLVLLFPHAILHEAALSFLGLGLSPHAPAIGIILSDALRFLSAGAWWLAVLPGLALLMVVKAVDTVGENLRALVDPRSVHE